MFYPNWSEKFNTITAFAAVFGSLVLVIREFFPETRLNYSKFTTDKKPGITVPSEYGMLIIYVPSAFLSAYLGLYESPRSSRMIIICLLNFLHYVKRVFEVMRVHRYSGVSKLKDNLSISFCYASYVAMVYIFSLQVPQISNFKLWLGVVLYFFGEGMNFYHHIILSRLRQDGSKSYKIPHDGLFKYMWCPHYTGEIITFLAIVLVSQHFIVFLLQLGSAAYLATRAYNTRIWYQKKFNTIPKRACLIPFIF